MASRPSAQAQIKRLLGLDRSGPLPPTTRSGAPMRPLTIPNLVGYLRLVAIPIFLYASFESVDGRSLEATLLYLWITAGDYLDGFLARATGQYSRLGALMDPVIDRLSVLAGVIVCWHFELLPRWALVVLAIREVVTLILARISLRRGIDIEISWVGRFGVAFVFAGLFLTIALDGWFAQLTFYVGVALGIVATLLYMQATRRRAGDIDPV